MKQFNNIAIGVANFESTFPKDYRKDDIEQVLRYVLAGKFCQLICLPGGGKATVLKLLAYNQSLRKFHLGQKESSFSFIYLNLLELPTLEKQPFDQPTIDKFLLLSLNRNIEPSNDPLLLSQKLKETVSKITGRHNQTQTLIFLFDHFDEFQNKLRRSFFQMLRTLRSLAKYKFSVVFATRRDLKELVDEELLREFYDFFVGNTVYMKLYDDRAIAFMLTQIEKFFGQKLTAEQKKKLIKLTGGHTKLTKVCAETVLQEQISIASDPLLQKPLIRATLFELWLFLTAEEQETLIAIASEKTVEQSDVAENLVRFGLLKQSSFTIPLFLEFVEKVVPSIPKQKITYDATTREIKKEGAIISDLLSPQEYRLLKFLIENENRLVEREEIVRAVWPEVKSVEGITEAAIDQMIFRLRKKIEDQPNSPRHILTVKGRGFRFVP